MKLNNSNTKLRRPPKKKLNENTELTAKLTIDSESFQKSFSYTKLQIWLARAQRKATEPTNTS